MVEVKIGRRTVDLPYTIHLHGVPDEMFDELVVEAPKAELILGKMFVYSPASRRYDNVAGFLHNLMRCYAAEKGLGSVIGPGGRVRISKARRVAPDLFFLSKDRAPNSLPKEYNGIPDLILELLSLPKSEVFWREKRPLYREVGIKEIWFVTPELRNITIDRLRGRYYVTLTKSSGRVESTVLDGFWIEADWLWSDPLPNEIQCLREILS